MFLASICFLSILEFPKFLAGTIWGGEYQCRIRLQESEALLCNVVTSEMTVQHGPEF